MLLTDENTYPSSRQRLGAPPSSMIQAGFLGLAPGRALVSVTDEDVQALMEAVRKCPEFFAHLVWAERRPALT